MTFSRYSALSNMHGRTAARPSQVKIDDLISLIARERYDVLPFVGSGLSIGAGAPSAAALATAVAERAAAPVDKDDPQLIDVVRQIEDRYDRAYAQALVDEVFTGLRPRITPALTAVAGTPTRRVLTTNYDDAIERAARARGVDAISLLPNEAKVTRQPAAGQLHVIHIHGMAGRPETLVLPGAATYELDDERAFQALVGSEMAAHTVVYLGFSFGTGEQHLRRLVPWLRRKVTGSGQHYLVLPEVEVEERLADIREFHAYRNLTVVPYAIDANHREVERVALALAPRSDGDATPVWMALTRGVAGEPLTDLELRMTGVRYGWSKPEEVVWPANLLETGRFVVVGGPGMGKTTLLSSLPDLATNRCWAAGHLTDFRPKAGDRPETAVQRLIRLADGEPIPIELLESESGLLLLDGLDEVAAEYIDDALRAVAAAMDRWPGHSWVIASRPGTAADELMAASGVTPLWITPSRDWVRTYFKARAVPADRIRRALLDGYGVGDLATIPIFAARLADRLLDDDYDETTPLELLVEHQLRIAQLEARRAGYPADALGRWLSDLAIGLELRGARDTDIAELDGLHDVAGVSASAIGRRLADATLLADPLVRVAFPAKPLQEGLCAKAILDSNDVEATVEYVAIADIAGTQRVRDDFDFTLDLVFEHASRSVRGDLRALDEQRWARTVFVHGNEDDGDEAFEVLWQATADPQRPFLWNVGQGLRSAQDALVAIVRRWPDILVRRSRGLQESLADPEAPRAHALWLLAELAPGDSTTSWLVPALADPDEHVVANAARFAARHGMKCAAEPLRARLKDPEERVRLAVLSALIEIVEPAELPSVVADFSDERVLRRVAPRLLELVDLDTGLALVAASHQLDRIRAWMLERLIESAHPAAWTESRVLALMAACRAVAGGGRPDPDLIASALRRHPAIAIGAVRLSFFGGRPSGPPNQLLALARLDEKHLAGEDHAQLREAISAALEAEKEIEARQDPKRRSREQLVALLNEHGEDLRPEQLTDVSVPHDLEPIHRARLLEVVRRWWPLPGRLSDLDALSQPELWAVSAGATLRAPLTANQWVELLDVYTQSERIERVVHFGSAAVPNWLASGYRSGEHEDAVLARISSAPDADVLALLVSLTVQSQGALSAAALIRLTELPPGTGAWTFVAGHLAARSDSLTQVRALLELSLDEDTRRALLQALADAGDEMARREVLDVYLTRVRQGEQPERPHWPNSTWEAQNVKVLGELVEAAIEQRDDQWLEFAIGHLGLAHTSEGLETLTRLNDGYGDAIPGIQERVMATARRLATLTVLERLPLGLGDVVADFHRVAAGTGSRP